MGDAIVESKRRPLRRARRRSIRGAVFATVATLTLGAAVGCDRAGDEAEDPRAPSAAAPGLPLGAVVFLLDTVRSDHVSSYGYARTTTPAIDALAREGVLFRQVASYSTWTLPSVVALLSGDYPPLVFDDRLRMKWSLVEAFAKAGYRTAAFTEGGYVSRRWGMDRGFQHYSEEAHTEDSTNEIEGTFRDARRWLEANGDSPFFLLIHTYEAHMPYTNRDFAQGLDPGRVGPTYQLEFLETVRSGEIVLTTEERDYIRALYDGDILSVDRHVGEFLELLEDLGLSERTVVVVTSDHGEEMGEEFETFIGGHGHSMRDNLLLVPLVIRDPTRTFPERRIDVQVRLIDVIPTIAELLGAQLEAPISGRSLVPVLEGNEKAHRAAMSGQNNRGTPRISLRDGRYKYVATIESGAESDAPAALAVPPKQLYDLQGDPGEDLNLVGDKPRLARTMANVLARWYNGLGEPRADATSEVLDEKLMRRLQALGYLD
jgi:arylsulfatase A-like enzyme